MADSTSKPGKGPGSNVVSLKPQPVAVVPVEGWEVRSKHGLLRFDGTDAGRLVRLADLVLWLMETKELPCLAAVGLVCDALQSNTAAAPWLYMLKETDYATPLTQQHSFLYRPILVQPWQSFCEEAPNDPADCGLAGAVKHMRADFVAPGGDLWGMLAPLSIRMDKAHELFGWGSEPATEAPSASDGGALDVTRLEGLAELVAYRAANMVKHGKGTRGPDWAIGNQLEVLGAALESALAKNGGKKGAARAAVGKLLGCSGENVNQALKTERKKTSPLPSVPNVRAAGGRK